MKTVPQAFYEAAAIEKIMVDGLSSIIYKEVETAALDNNRFVATPALTMVLEGVLQITTYEGEVIRVSDKEMVLIPKGIYMISDIIPLGSKFKAIVFFFEEKLISEFLNELSPFKDEVNVSGLNLFKRSQSIDIYIDALMKLYRGQKSNKPFTNVKLFELLHLLALTKEGPSFINALRALENRTRKNVAQFMNSNFDKPLSIEDYAYLTGRSISTFSRDFKRQFGCAPKQWLIDRRLEKAIEIFKAGNSSVTQTAFEVGYENLSHFIKVFRKRYGLSPKQYILQNRKELVV